METMVFSEKILVFPNSRVPKSLRLDGVGWFRGTGWDGGIPFLAASGGPLINLK